jgi:hypothetical protein
MKLIHGAMTMPCFHPWAMPPWPWPAGNPSEEEEEVPLFYIFLYFFLRIATLREGSYGISLKEATNQGSDLSPPTLVQLSAHLSPVSLA